MYQYNGSNEAFPLKSVEHLLSELYIPDVSLVSQNNFRCTYKMFCLAGGNKPGKNQTGTLTFEKKGGRTEDDFLFGMKYEKFSLGKYKHITTAEIQCRNNFFASPIQWAMNYQVETPSGQKISSSQSNHSSKLTGNKLVIKSKSGERVSLLKGPCSINWVLFEAVGRLKDTDFGVREFTLIDHFDQVKPCNMIYFKYPLKIDCDKQNSNKHLDVFEQTGKGILPITYYRDSNGCVVMVVSGLEVYLLENIEL